MKFILSDNKMTLATGIGEAIKERGKVDNFEHADYNFWHSFAERAAAKWDHDMTELGQLIIDLIPDLLAYGAILAGICIIVGAMVGSGNMMKAIAIYGGFLIIGICILMAV